MFGVDADIATSAVRMWSAAGLAATLLLVCALAFVWRRAAALKVVAGPALGVLGAFLAAMMAWSFVGGAGVRDQGAERRALERRAAELSLRALAPGSPLACLDGLAGETVEAVCESAIFAAPAALASAVSYVAARFMLLTDMVAYSNRGGADIGGVLLPLGRALEADRFGLLAHALAERDGCTREHCEALALLHNPSRVRANLGENTFGRYLNQHAANWAQPGVAPVADAGQGQPTAAAAPSGAGGPHKVTVNIDFPSSASIPPISIMNPEPKGSAPAPAAAANPNAPPATASSPRRARRPAVAPSAPGAAAAAEPVEPVWMPAPLAPTTQSPATPAPPAASSSSGGAAPVQLNPFPASSEPNAGMAARTP